MGINKVLGKTNIVNKTLVFSFVLASSNLYGISKYSGGSKISNPSVSCQSALKQKYSNDFSTLPIVMKIPSRLFVDSVMYILPGTFREFLMEFPEVTSYKAVNDHLDKIHDEQLLMLKTYMSYLEKDSGARQVIQHSVNKLEYLLNKVRVNIEMHLKESSKKEGIDKSKANIIRLFANHRDGVHSQEINLLETKFYIFFSEMSELRASLNFSSISGVEMKGRELISKEEQEYLQDLKVGLNHFKNLEVDRSLYNDLEWVEVKYISQRFHNRMRADLMRKMKTLINVASALNQRDNLKRKVHLAAVGPGSFGDKNINTLRKMGVEVHIIKKNSFKILSLEELRELFKDLINPSDEKSEVKNDNLK